MLKFTALFFGSWYLLTLLFPSLPGGQGKPVTHAPIHREDTSATDRFIVRERLLHYIETVVNPSMTAHSRSLLATAILESSLKYAIDPYLVLGVIYTESNGNAWAENNGSLGIMQVMPKWWDKKLRAAGIIRRREDYFNTALGVEAGCYVLQDCFRRAGGGDVRQALAYYSGSRSRKYADKALTFINKERKGR